MGPTFIPCLRSWGQLENWSIHSIVLIFKSQTILFNYCLPYCLNNFPQKVTLAYRDISPFSFLVYCTVFICLNLNEPTAYWVEPFHCVFALNPSTTIYYVTTRIFLGEKFLVCHQSLVNVLLCIIMVSSHGCSSLQVPLSLQVCKFICHPLYSYLLLTNFCHSFTIFVYGLCMHDLQSCQVEHVKFMEAWSSRVIIIIITSWRHRTVLVTQVAPSSGLTIGCLCKRHHDAVRHRRSGAAHFWSLWDQHLLFTRSLSDSQPVVAEPRKIKMKSVYSSINHWNKWYKSVDWASLYLLDRLWVCFSSQLLVNVFLEQIMGGNWRVSLALSHLKGGNCQI